DRTTAVEGVVKDVTGEPTGELREVEAMALVGPFIMGVRGEGPAQATADAARLAARAGCTTISDWAFGDAGGAFDAYRTVAGDPATGMRFVLAPFYRFLLSRGGGDIQRAVDEHMRLQAAAGGT